MIVHINKVYCSIIVQTYNVTRKFITLLDLTPSFPNPNNDFPIILSTVLSSIYKGKHIVLDFFLPYLTYIMFSCSIHFCWKGWDFIFPHYKPKIVFSSDYRSLSCSHGIGTFKNATINMGIHKFGGMFNSFLLNN